MSKPPIPPIKGKILLHGSIQCCSPFHIGSGKDERCDLDVLLDEQQTPYIPATSLVGVLYHAFPPLPLVAYFSNDQYTELLNEFPKAASLLEPLKEVHENIASIALGAISETQRRQLGKAFAKLEQNAINIIKQFWGYTEKEDGHQSTFRCSDLTVCQDASHKVTIRDGIAIVNATGIVKDKSKYAYEVVEPGTTFELKMEFSYRDDDEDFVKRMVATIYALLKDGQIRIGAKTNSGLGAIQLIEDQTHIHKFDFSDKEHVRCWFTQDIEGITIPVSELGEALTGNDNQFTIEATLQLKNSLIIRSYSADPKMSDATHIKSNDDWVLTGASLKGAIRARAERIVNTLGKPASIITDLFGYVQETFKLTEQSFLELERKFEHEGKEIPKRLLDQLREKLKDREYEQEEQFLIDLEKTMPGEQLAGYQPLILKYAKPRAKKGRIQVKEVTLPKYPAEVQTRIKIDRFTGGTIAGALFDSMPLFNKDEQTPIEHVQIVVNDCEDYEAGLLLLVLKDLWSGDLAVGGEKNVGRGVFTGIQAIVEWNGKKIWIEEDLGKLSSDQKKILQGYVDTLNTV